ncbi:MAG: PorV/PorQ family protein [bacterium]
MRKLVLVLGLMANSLWPGEGEKSAAFLKLGAGARPGGMGGAYCAIADDSSANYWNPAGLTQLSQKEGSFMYHCPMSEVDGLSYSNLNLALPQGNQGFGVSLVYLGYGSEKGYDRDKKPINDWSASDLAISGSYARKINKSLSLGASLKAIMMKIEDESAKAFCLDSGILYKDAYPNLNLAAVIKNLGTKPKFISEKFSLPLSLRLGAAYNLQNTPIPLLIGLDTNISPFSISLGLEGKIYQNFSLRLGYSNSQDEGPGITAGFGLQQSNFGIDYAIKPFGELGLSHYISLKAGF